MTRVVIVSGGCGVGKTATLRAMRTTLGVEVATFETDTFYEVFDPTWSVPWPEAKRYVDLARLMLVHCVRALIDENVDLIAIGSNGLCEEADVRTFAQPFIADPRVTVHHVTLDPGTEVVQRRVADRALPVDEQKTPDWLASQMDWFRERYGDWTYVLDNTDLTPEGTAAAIHDVVECGDGRLA